MKTRLAVQVQKLRRFDLAQAMLDESAASADASVAAALEKEALDACSRSVAHLTETTFRWQQALARGDTANNVRALENDTIIAHSTARNARAYLDRVQQQAATKAEQLERQKMERQKAAVRLKNATVLTNEAFASDQRSRDKKRDDE